MGKKISRYFQNFFYLVFKFFFVCFHCFFKGFEAIIFTFLTVRYIQGQKIKLLFFFVFFFSVFFFSVFFIHYCIFVVFIFTVRRIFIWTGAEYSCFVTSEPIHICQYLETVFSYAFSCTFSYAFFIKIAILSSITPGIFIFRIQDQRRCGFISFFCKYTNLVLIYVVILYLVF